MTYVLVVSNIIMLVSMFIAAFWGFTYPKKIVDGYESGKSAFVAAFMCCLAGICLCGLNFQNYYLLVTYALLHLLIMLNQLFNIIPFSWTRIPNYPLTGSVSTQVYITLGPKILLVTFAFALAYKLRRDEKRYELASTGGYHHRLPCHIVPRPEPRCQAAPINSGQMYSSSECQAYGQANKRVNGNPISAPQAPPPHPLRMLPGNVAGPGPTGQPPAPIAAPQPPVPSIPPPPPPTSSTNQIIQTPPIYPLHRPSVTDISINSPIRPIAPSGVCHHSMPPPTNCPSAIGNHSSSCGGGLNDIAMMDEHESLTRTRSSGVHWRTTPYEVGSVTPTKWWPSSAKQQYGSYYRDVYNPNFWDDFLLLAICQHIPHSHPITHHKRNMMIITWICSMTIT